MKDNEKNEIIETENISEKPTENETEIASAVTETESTKEEKTSSTFVKTESTEKKDLADKMDFVLSKIGNVLSIIGIALCCIMALILLWFGFERLILNKKNNSIFGYSSFIVTTGSMQSTINIGDLVIVKAGDNYKFGEIITFYPEGATIPTTHRIIKVNEDGSFVTKGDYNNAKDTEDCKPDMIVGRVVKIVPDVGIFIEWVKTGGGLIYIIAFIGIFAAGVYILKKK